jgi:formylglycine-generating enzyme required for sulfatase activity
MFRQARKGALLALAALGSLPLTIAVTGCGEHPPASKPENTAPKPPLAGQKEIAFDLGGGVKLEMVLIPAGDFLMGSPDSDKDADGHEKPQHRVRIAKPFYLGKYLVTQEQWQSVMGSNPSTFKGPKNSAEPVPGNPLSAASDALPGLPAPSPPPRQAA